MDQFSHDPFSNLSADDLARQRNSSRDSLLLTAQFRVVGEPASQVRVRNLSAGGLMAEHPQPLPQGTRVEVEVRGIGWVTGHIAWWAEGRVGMAFDHEIDPMLARKPVGTGTHTPNYAKPLIPGRR